MTTWSCGLPPGQVGYEPGSHEKYCPRPRKLTQLCVIPDVAELEERCRQAQAEAEAVLAQGRNDCEALEDEVIYQHTKPPPYASPQMSMHPLLTPCCQVRTFRADRDELLSQLAAERHASSKRKDEAAAKDKELAAALQEKASAMEEAKRQRQEVEVLHREVGRECDACVLLRPAFAVAGDYSLQAW